MINKKDRRKTVPGRKELRRLNEIRYAGKHMLTHHVARHAHTSWELIYCTGGNGTLLFDGEELPYKEGDIVVIPPDLPHKNNSSEGFTNLHLNLVNCSLKLKTPVLLHDDGNAFVLQAFSAAYYHFCTPGEQYRPLLEAYGNLIVAYLSLYLKSPKRSRIVERIESEIIENYADSNFELDQALRRLPFSYDYLRRLFKKELGITPHQYLTEKRLEAAANQLRDMPTTGNNIAEISHMCGFREPLYFSRMFKKKYGVSPSYYLEAEKKEGQLLDEESVKVRMEDV